MNVFGWKTELAVSWILASLLPSLSSHSLGFQKHIIYIYNNIILRNESDAQIAEI